MDASGPDGSGPSCNGSCTFPSHPDVPARPLSVHAIHSHREGLYARRIPSARNRAGQMGPPPASHPVLHSGVQKSCDQNSEVKMEPVPLNWSLSCSPGELYTLASLLGGEMLIGVPDPFPGWLTEEIQAAMEEARQSLTAREVLALRDDGQMVMDVAAAALVGTLVSPQAAFIITAAAPEQPLRQVNLYYRAPLTVAMEGQDGDWMLGFLPDTTAIARRVQELWHLGPQKVVRVSSFTLPEKEMERARQACALGEKEVLDRLREAGVPPTSARAMARTLTAPRQNGAMVALCFRQGVWDTGGLGILEGENGLWLLRSFSRQGANWIECIPRSGQQLMAEVETLVRRFLPPQEV